MHSCCCYCTEQHARQRVLHCKLLFLFFFLIKRTVLIKVLMAACAMPVRAGRPNTPVNTVGPPDSASRGLVASTRSWLAGYFAECVNVYAQLNLNAHAPLFPSSAILFADCVMHYCTPNAHTSGDGCLFPLSFPQCTYLFLRSPFALCSYSRTYS